MLCCFKLRGQKLCIGTGAIGQLDSGDVTQMRGHVLSE